MSLKLVELQVAIPRTQDAGKVSEQLSMRGQHMQDHITSKLEKDEQKKRKQVNESNDTGNVNINNKDDTSNNLLQGQQQKKKVVAEEKKEKHPFKGNFIDIVG